MKTGEKMKNRLKFSFVESAKKQFSEKDFLKIFRKGKEVLNSRIMKLTEGKAVFLSLILVDDTYIHQLNREFRGKDAPTDVLSFTYDVKNVSGGKGLTDAVGEIYISLDTAKRQAAEKGYPLLYELQFLFVHGFLHVFGFDHETDKDEAEMNRWGKRIFGVWVA